MRLRDDADVYVPLRWSALLLDLGEDAFCFVVLAVTAGRQFAIALDLLLPAHVASLGNGQNRQLPIPPASFIAPLISRCCRSSP